MLLPSCKNFSYIYLLTFFFKEIGMRYIEISKFYQVQRIVSVIVNFWKKDDSYRIHIFNIYFTFLIILLFSNFSFTFWIYVQREIFSSLLDIYFPPSKMRVVRNKPSIFVIGAYLQFCSSRLRNLLTTFRRSILPILFHHHLTRKSSFVGILL